MPTARLAELCNRTLAVIMGGGQGSRLFPLTRERAKPAVPLAGKYRLVDIPISNCINSGIMRMYLLTQFNSASLHRHISQSYKFDHFRNGFVEILAAEQTFASTSWYQGTADAVRKNLMHLQNTDFRYALILSGDQLYRMDFQKIIEQHADSSADVTVATIPVMAKDASALGIMQVNGERRITRFVEKPKDPAVLESLKVDRASYGQLGIQADTDLYLASMGIYVFNREVLFELLNNNLHIYPMAGAARLRLDGAEGSEQELAFLREAAKGARLVILDPLRQFHSGDENDSWVMTNLVHQCLAIATQERCAFILAHHTNKQATVTGYGDKAAASRGSAALTDAARWQLNLSELDHGLARERGIPQVDAWQYVKVDLAKANYLPEQPPVVLHKGVGGVLETVSEKVRSKGASA